jgi:hypothetical protein
VHYPLGAHHTTPQLNSSHPIPISSVPLSLPSPDISRADRPEASERLALRRSCAPDRVGNQPPLKPKTRNPRDSLGRYCSDRKVCNIPTLVLGWTDHNACRRDSWQYNTRHLDTSTAGLSLSGGRFSYRRSLLSYDPRGRKEQDKPLQSEVDPG